MPSWKTKYRRSRNFHAIFPNFWGNLEGKINSPGTKSNAHAPEISSTVIISILLEVHVRAGNNHWSLISRAELALLSDTAGSQIYNILQGRHILVWEGMTIFSTHPDI